MLLFALKGTENLGRSIAESLELELAPNEERDFEDGEHKARPLTSVRMEDVYVVHSLNGEPGASANDKLVRLLFFIACCKENGARRVTAITPYLAYSRKDRQTKSRDPVTTRYVAQLFETVGTDRLITLDVHNYAAFQNAFRCETVHLTARRLFVNAIRRIAGSGSVAVFSPDGGGVKRAQLLKELLETEPGTEIGFGFMEKRRSRGVVSGDLFAGDVDGRAVFILDDMIVSGGTMLRAAEACRERGAKSVYALATHALFGESAANFLGNDLFDAMLVTDSVSSARKARSDDPKGKLQVLAVGPVIAKVIERITGHGSISDLLAIED